MYILQSGEENCASLVTSVSLALKTTFLQKRFQPIVAICSCYARKCYCSLNMYFPPTSYLVQQKRISKRQSSGFAVFFSKPQEKPSGSINGHLIISRLDFKLKLQFKAFWPEQHAACTTHSISNQLIQEGIKFQMYDS